MKAKLAAEDAGNVSDKLIYAGREIRGAPSRPNRMGRNLLFSELMIDEWLEKTAQPAAELKLVKKG